MKKKVSKNNENRRGRRPADPNAPIFDPKKHVKLSDLAKKCRISYQSMYLRQEKDGIKAIVTRQLSDAKKGEKSYAGVEVIAFTKKDAKRIEENSPKQMRTDSVTFSEMEKEFDISRPKLTGFLLKLKITPTKRQGNSNRQTLTVTKAQYNQIKQEILRESFDLSEIEKDFKLTKPKLEALLSKLEISPVKLQDRSIVTRSEYKKIKKEVRA
jgi:hypothetical protein